MSTPSSDSSPQHQARNSSSRGHTSSRQGSNKPDAPHEHSLPGARAATNTGTASPAQPHSRRGNRTRANSRRNTRKTAANKPRRSSFTPFTAEQLDARRAACPTITYPEQLPVSARRDEIAKAIAENQVVIIAGETGSGKTTQLPKICMELGRGVTGLIGHTQPRRIAARSVAERICAELGVKLGGAVGYQVRFTDEVGPTTLVKLMTDGILLAEIQSDPDLLRYDTLIIDEAHERSLNIDFILGYLARLLPRRPDLKVIITSATIDTERFADHFGNHTSAHANNPATESTPAPIIEVSGRTYPVEIRYRPLRPESMDDDARDSSSETRGAQPHGDSVGHIHSASHTSGQFYTELDGPETPGRAEAVDQVTGIIEACQELMAEGPGDILVFLSGEGEIRDTQQAFEDELGRKYIAPGGRSSVPGAVEVLPLFARLSAAEQHRIFEPHQHRRIILATNIAETSLTVPGIRYVVDPGTARISRYSNKTKVQRLPIEPVSQASANQRAGRCGRVADGICIRLYSEADFAHRDEFTQPEIQRTSLASVILQMISLGLGDVSKFPFIDPPDDRAVRAGAQLLEEIGAVDTRPVRGRETGPRLTKIGWQLARLPIDPRLGRMLIEAERNGCASEVLVLVAALSVQDVRERPTEKRPQADQLHARFTARSSDFLAYLTMWRYLHTQQRELSGSTFRRMCRAEFLNYLRYREWTDVVSQLTQMAKPLGLSVRPLAMPSREQIREAEAAGAGAGTPGGAINSGAVAVACRDFGRSADTPEAGAIHRSMLVGLLSNLGNYSEKSRDYVGARGTHFVVWPGSGLHRRTPAWVMAAELVETSRLFARTVAAIEPSWIEPLAKHLVKKSYSEPVWSTRNGAAMCTERVTLYGMTLVADRHILLSSVGTDSARELAREMFIRHGLVEGDWRTHHEFLRANKKALEEAGETESKLRRHGIIADDDVLAAFYDERVPANVVSGRHFDSWWKKEKRENPHLLDFTQELLLGGAGASEGDYPDEWVQGDISLPISYSFNPGAYGDGVTVTIPVTLLPQLEPAGFDWLVPGMRDELVQGTIRALPKRVRRQLVPAPDVVRDLLPLLPAWDDVAHGQPGAPSFQEAFTQAVRELRGIEIDEAAWRETDLPAHLRMWFRVRSERGAVLDEGESLEHLQAQLAPRAKSAVESVVKGAVAMALDEARRGLLASPGNRSRAGAPEDSASSTDYRDDEGAARRAIQAALAADKADDALESWPSVTDGIIPASVETTGPDGMVVRGYPAIALREASNDGQALGGGKAPSSGKASSGGKAAGAGAFGWKPVGLSVLAEPAIQVRDHRTGLVHLLARNLEMPEARVTSRWPGDMSLALAGSPYPSTAALVADLQLAAARNVAERWCQTQKIKLGELRSRDHWDALVAWARDRHEDEVFALARIAADICTHWAGVSQAIKKATSVALLATVADLRAQLSELVPAGFVVTTPSERLPHLVRYLKAAAMRLEKAATNPAGDDALAWQIQEVSERLAAAREAASARQYDPAVARALVEARWAIEELRVSLFAQQLGTQGKVSAKRIEKMLAGV
ncbi:DUF3418 domain-containing protein [Arcanobacterium haemolyticum]|nr:DUF3418 domain-containing protein [Arcanobacterium haemolyticum]